MSCNDTKRIQNAMKQITLNYQARGFNVVSAFGDDEFDHLKDWMRNELHIDLDICAADSHVLRAELVISVEYQKIILWIYHEHSTRKKCAGNCLNLTSQ